MSNNVRLYESVFRASSVGLLPSLSFCKIDAATVWVLRCCIPNFVQGEQSNNELEFAVVAVVAFVAVVVVVTVIAVVVFVAVVGVVAVTALEFDDFDDDNGERSLELDDFDDAMSRALLSH